MTRSTLETLSSSPCEIKDLRQLQVKLRKCLEGKKFLLVPEDVWNENYVHMEARLL